MKPVKQLSCLDVVALEDRLAPAIFPFPVGAVFIAPEDSGIPRIKVVDSNSGEDIGEIQAYEDTFRGGVHIALGDVNGDGTRDLVIAPGAGGGPRIKILDGRNGNTLADFFVYEPNFRGGVSIALGDVNNDGRDDIITGTGRGGGPRVRVLDGAALGSTVIRDFFAYEPNFRGGVLVAAGDINHDGRDDIITGTGPTGGPRVTVFDALSQSRLDDFFAYDNRFRGGVLVSSGDINGDGRDDIITGTGPGGGAVVRSFGNNGSFAFLADDSAFRGGVRVGSDDLNGDGRDEWLTWTRHGNEATLRIFDGQTAGFQRSITRRVDDNPNADNTFIRGGTLIPGTLSAIEGIIVAVNPNAGTVDLRLANGAIVVVQVGAGTEIERNDQHTTLATFVVGEKGQALIGPDGIAWKIEAQTGGIIDDDNNGGGGVNGIVAGKIEGRITAINVNTRQVTIQRTNGTSVVVTAAANAIIERNDQHTTLAAFVVGDRGEALLGLDGLAVKIEAYAINTGGGNGGPVTGNPPPANSNIEGTITAIDLATNRVTIRTSNGSDFLIQVVNGTKVERNDVETTIGSFLVGDFGQAKTNISGFVFKLEAVG